MYKRQIILGFDYEGKPFTVKDLGVAGAVTVLLKDAIHPNPVSYTHLDVYKRQTVNSLAYRHQCPLR